MTNSKCFNCIVFSAVIRVRIFILMTKIVNDKDPNQYKKQTRNVLFFYPVLLTVLKHGLNSSFPKTDFYYDLFCDCLFLSISEFYVMQSN